MRRRGTDLQKFGFKNWVDGPSSEQVKIRRAGNVLTIERLVIVADGIWRARLFKAPVEWTHSYT